MTSDLTIGVLALQGAFEEHQACIEKATGCKTIQVRVYYYQSCFKIVYIFSS